MKRFAWVAFAAWIAVRCCGCGPEAVEKPGEQGEPQKPDSHPAEPEMPTLGPTEPSAAREQSSITTEQQLKAALKQMNPGFEGEVGVGGDGQNILAVMINDRAVEDISPLAGLPLAQLDLTGCQVTDIGVLKGMPLTILYLGGTGVRDIRVLKRMPLVELFLNDTKVNDLSPLKGAAYLKKLNLMRTRVSDLDPLRGMRRLEMLWLTGCPVSDIRPLQEVPSLVSLTIAETRVSDLSPLKAHPSLRRLHIAGSEVTDLSPLKWMQLTRLIFTPRRINRGMRFARQMETLRQIDVEFDGAHRPMSAAEFWRRYDAGEFQ